jgi:hypothetical protein
MAFLKGIWQLKLEAGKDFQTTAAVQGFVLDARVTSLWPNWIFNSKVPLMPF